MSFLFQTTVAQRDWFSLCLHLAP